ncbi:TetR/AcrR family transcriptional regulator [Bacillus sp. 31A1R]|uniref:TetR/AcrR family transcriptional regulator n=1 Tax=Robertmurraya mangrovi TaxID=3098077 RepID=A0ABU5J3H3_9BACI|nr:TetR/AcrR family transcriptional regulator [Bacillus sp. 31A1R]MDZ5473948.1 TetR/AcrR family transcriptional regulator [Bacillus sp. 31A1R]
MNGFERRKLNKMNQIRQAAFSLFTKYGIQKVNIQEISKKANVSQVTIYNYFGSKDELVYDVMNNYLENQLTDFIQLTQSPLSFEEKMEKLIHLKIESTKELSPEFLKTILTENPQVAKLFQEFAYSKTMPLLYEFLESGKDSGIISKDLSKDTILFILNSLTNSVINQTNLFQSSEQINRFTKEFMQFFFYGLTGKKE